MAWGPFVGHSWGLFCLACFLRSTCSILPPGSAWDEEFPVGAFMNSAPVAQPPPLFGSTVLFSAAFWTGSKPSQRQAHTHLAIHAVRWLNHPVVQPDG